MQQAIYKLTSYIDALRPIIYIQHFDFQAVDDLIWQTKGEQDTLQIYEFTPGMGYVDFLSKSQKAEYTLKGFLNLIEDSVETNAYVVLKDIHHYLGDPEIIALLKAISLKNMRLENYNVTIFIVATKQVIPDELEPFITIFNMPHPGIKEIEDIIQNFATMQEINIDDEVIDSLALSFKGLTTFEIIQILNLAYQAGGDIGESDKHLILNEKEQIIKKSGLVEIVNFKETLEDIGGLEYLKEWLEQKATIFKKLDKAIKFGVDIPKGTLIVGMPGCGKSLTAKATARLFDVPLLRMDVGKLLGKYMGESEENMSRALKISEAASPCVLWIDEIEKAFAGIGDGGGHEVTSRLFGYFLTWLQEKDSTVFVVATANDISKLPPEFLRKGRFDELFFVDFPAAEERKKIFEIHLKKRNKWDQEINTIQLLNETEGFSGADIEAVVREVIEKAFMTSNNKIDTDDLLEVIRDTKSLSQLLKDKIEDMKKTISKMDIKSASKSQIHV